MSSMFKETKFKQPEKFEFTKENQEKIKGILAKYPAGHQQSAVMPLLDLAQRQHNNWIPRAAMDHIADILGMPHIKVYEVATFYTMYNKQPVGKNLIQICRTSPCWLRGSDEVTKACTSKLGIGVGETTKDGKFTLVEVECLGACVNAPVVQINDDFYEDLDHSSMTEILETISAGKKPKVGSQSGRQCSAPVDFNGELDKKPTKIERQTTKRITTQAKTPSPKKPRQPRKKA